MFVLVSVANFPFFALLTDFPTVVSCGTWPAPVDRSVVSSMASDSARQQHQSRGIAKVDG